MPGILHIRMAIFRSIHPDVKIHKPKDGMWLPPEERIWSAVIPLGGTYERFLAGPGQSALLDKLDRAMGDR